MKDLLCLKERVKQLAPKGVNLPLQLTLYLQVQRRGSERGRASTQEKVIIPSFSPSSSRSSDATRSEEDRATHHPHRRCMCPQCAWRRSQKFKEGGKNVTFLTYDGAYGQTDKLLSSSNNLMQLLVEKTLRSLQSSVMSQCISISLHASGGKASRRRIFNLVLGSLVILR